MNPGMRSSARDGRETPPEIFAELQPLRPRPPRHHPYGKGAALLQPGR